MQIILIIESYTERTVLLKDSKILAGDQKSNFVELSKYVEIAQTVVARILQFFALLVIFKVPTKLF